MEVKMKKAERVIVLTRVEFCQAIADYLFKTGAAPVGDYDNIEVTPNASLGIVTITMPAEPDRPPPAAAP